MPGSTDSIITFQSIYIADGGGERGGKGWELIGEWGVDISFCTLPSWMS